MQINLLLREKDKRVIAKNFRTGTLLAQGGAPRGQSAYEQAVEGGYTGTKEEFEEALASDISAISENIEDIATVASAIEDIETVAADLTDIHTVAENTTDVNTVATDISNVNTVAGISSDVSQVAGISSAVSTVSAHDSEVTLVADNMASVMTTASSITDVQNVASDITNINTVAGISSDVSTVATNSTAVNTAATNMAAIIAAPTAAQNAATSATNAQKWAEGADSDVTPLGGTHSSKGWANVAKQYAESIGAALKYKGSVSTYSALPSTGQEIGDMWNVLDTGKNYAWTGTEWDDLSGVVDLSAYRTSAAQDLIDATKQDALVSGTNIKTVNNNSLLGSGNVYIDALPSQTGQSGKFLTTDGTNASWDTISGSFLPSTGGTMHPASGETDVRIEVIDNNEDSIGELNFNQSLSGNNNVELISKGNIDLRADEDGSISLDVSGGNGSINLSSDTGDINLDTQGDVNINGNPIKPLPDQTGNSGKVLTTDGTTASWETPLAVMPDYANGLTVGPYNSSVWTQVTKDSFVVVRANDPFTTDAYLYVSPDNGTTTYTVGWWYNDINSYTKGSSWSFFVPKGWYFTSQVENPYTAYIYPFLGAQ